MNKEETPETFAYVLHSCVESTELRDDLAHYLGNYALVYFIEIEEQSDTPDRLYDDWQEHMRRIAPVQLTNGWDSGPYLIALFEHCGIESTFTMSSESNDNAIYFEVLPSPQALAAAIDAVDPGHLPIPGDKQRLCEVLAATIQLARSEQRGLLFMGGFGTPYEGGSYYIERDVVQAVLREAGFQFYDRQVKSEFSEEPEPKYPMDPVEECVNNLKQLSLAMMMCTQDNDGHLPDAANWCSALAPYLEPDHELLTCVTAGLPYGYAMNANLSGLHFEAIHEPQLTVLLFESSLGTRDAHGTGESLPVPARHPNGNVVVTADGRVAILKEEAAGALKWTAE